jgi:WD40 repeat-containing protein SMU1
LRPHVIVVPDSRLISLLSQAVKWQIHSGLISNKMEENSNFDIFTGIFSNLKNEVKEKSIKFISKNFVSINMGESHAECGLFSPNGQFFVTGSIDGYVEIWNYKSGKLRTDIPYQNAEQLIFANSPILALDISHDNAFIASGTQSGIIQIWKLESGVCTSSITAHHEGITSLKFSFDSSQILSASFDATARIHGLKSNLTIKEFRGHASFVNSAIYYHQKQIITCSSDSTIKLWDIKSSYCLRTFTFETSVLQVLHLRQEFFAVCCKSKTITIIRINEVIIVSNVRVLPRMLSRR